MVPCLLWLALLEYTRMHKGSERVHCDIAIGSIGSAFGCRMATSGRPWVVREQASANSSSAVFALPTRNWIRRSGLSKMRPLPRPSNAHESLTNNCQEVTPHSVHRLASSPLSMSKVPFVADTSPATSRENLDEMSL
jgi:hypothetical protein